MIQIYEFEDFAKYCAMQEWMYIKEQLEDGEENIIDPTTKNHKDFVVFWQMVADFRHQHKLPYICYDQEGNKISVNEYYEFLSALLEKHGTKGKFISDYYYLEGDEQ